MNRFERQFIKKFLLGQDDEPAEEDVSTEEKIADIGDNFDENFDQEKSVTWYGLGATIFMMTPTIASILFSGSEALWSFSAMR